EASTAYRYWSYWTAESGATGWQYATEGSGTRVPSDGAVEGWRFGIAGDATRIQPGTLPDFAAICADVEAPTDGKRVAVVIDPGSTEEAPENEAPGSVITQCVVTPNNSTGLQILQTIAEVRMDAGFVCGVNGYPTQECAPLVELPEAIDTAAAVDASASNTEEVVNSSTQLPAESTSTGTPLITAATVSVLALVGFGIWRHRRREHA
ncbi:MAG: SCO2322 family protein, partial [Actinomycetota bacterium]|nr:SCO2322 family protein [Actinomycetota bacterium]